MYQAEYDYTQLADPFYQAAVNKTLRTKRDAIEVERKAIFDWLMKDGAIVPALTVQANAYAAWRALNEAYFNTLNGDRHTSENLKYVERIYRRTRKTMDALISKPEVSGLSVNIRSRVEMAWAERYGSVIFTMLVDYGDSITNEIILQTIRCWRDKWIDIVIMQGDK